MTLINKILKELEDPNNREIVNSGQDEFFIFHQQQTDLTTAGIYVDFDFMATVLLTQLAEPLKLFVIRHCINLLPCFDVENTEYDKVTKSLVNYFKVFGAKSDAPHITINGKQYDLVPKTMRQALLCSGAMTVEELEQEYLKLIN